MELQIRGRPKEQGGHRHLNVSMDDETLQALKKVSNKSKFIEEKIGPILRQMDPGPACKNVVHVLNYISDEVVKAVGGGHYEKAMALSDMANSLKDYRDLCGLDVSATVKQAINNVKPMLPFGNSHHVHWKFWEKCVCNGDGIMGGRRNTSKHAKARSKARRTGKRLKKLLKNF